MLRPGGHLLASDLHPAAAAQGWRRRFETDAGGWVDAQAAPLPIEQWMAWLTEAGLHLDVLREPVVGPALEPYFRRAGRRDFGALSGTPLLVVFRAGKGGRP